MKHHETYIKRCIDIAKKGFGFTRPNPMVGAVIVKNDKIIGEGFTSPYGGPHAEVNAINSVLDKSLLTESVLYVTLEPCSHFGKTPPCSDLIIKHQIKKVVIGCRDANPKVSGAGINKLKTAGCDVTVGVLEKECREHHKRFFSFHEKKRPYIILKWAETQDGFIAPLSRPERKPIWISNMYSRQLVHKWRTEEQAILVGTNTIRKDDPALTVRHWKGNNPTRVIIDKNNALDKDLKVFNSKANTIVVSKDNCDFSQPIAGQIAALLYEHNINSVIVEGGAHTLQSFIDEGLWDEARIFTGPVIFKDGIAAPQFKGQPISTEMIRGDILNYYRND
ncbi:MAG: bifunctional diaminohydroxyphosphoribosylaminopyrimidine deaminase/5-amino-6-(5-phosphoribosylamino)uracil reductase RibD [Bacteroidia bacterium]|nr:bifunctional diaminohydroxyphosphoribosylaminopyrimidine deaminase/5-amino-6-(5-phosphoribosylamino)uracil reductase RibD [Bacteroidia bacterium]